MDHLPRPATQEPPGEETPHLAAFPRILRPHTVPGRLDQPQDRFETSFGYTNEVVRRYGLPCEVSNADIYGTGYADEVLSVKTAYEKRFLEMGLPITYTRFSLAGRHEFPWFDWEEDEKAEKDNEEARQG